MEKKNQMNQNNSIEVEPLDQIKQRERLSILADELIKMKPRRKIVEEYSKKWECSPATIRTLLAETIVWLSTEMKIEREDLRVLNSERLDELFGDPNASVRDRIKIIDTMNKLQNLYDNNVKVAIEDDIKIDIGV